MMAAIVDQSTGSNKRGELAQRVSGGHFGLKIFPHAECGDDRVEVYGRLGHFRLAEVFVGTFKHDVGDAETEDIIGFFKQFLGEWVCVIEFFTHSYKLCSLSGKYKCFHIVYLVLVI